MRKEYNVRVIKKNWLMRVLTNPYVLSLTLILFSAMTMAKSPLATQKQIGMFLNSTTCVVLENGINPYNSYIKDAVEKHWKITTYEFIDIAEFENRRDDSKYSFLVLMKNVYDNDPGGVSYDYISLVLGDRMKDMTSMPELGSIPLLYSNDSNLDYEYAIPAIVMFLQKHAKKLEKKRFLISIFGLSYYNSSNFKDMQLLMNEDKMAPDANSVAKINSVYPYYFELLSSSEIKEKIASNPKKTMFHFHVGPNQELASGNCFEMIFDTYGNLHYYNSREITNENKEGFNIKDFKRIR